jgi:hypothetical protein
MGDLAFRPARTEGGVLLSRIILRFWILISSGIYVAMGSAGHSATFASVNLCTDLLLMKLSNADAVVSLGPLARHPQLSFNFRKASEYKINRGSTEEFLVRKPSVLFMGRFDTRPSRVRLKAAGINIYEMQPWTGMKQGLRQIREVGAIVGAEANRRPIWSRRSKSRWPYLHRFRRPMRGRKASPFFNKEVMSFIRV